MQGKEAKQSIVQLARGLGCEEDLLSRSEDSISPRHQFAQTLQHRKNSKQQSSIFGTMSNKYSKQIKVQQLTESDSRSYYSHTQSEDSSSDQELYLH